MGCHVGLTYAGAFGYADDIALVAPTLSSLKQMIQICEQFAESHSIMFNPLKTKLLCFNMKLEFMVPPIYLNGERLSIVENEKHLGNMYQQISRTEILLLMYVIFINAVIY